MSNFYRVKNGNWNLAESWATTSGGTTYHATTPTIDDDIFFDANTPSGTHTINIRAECLNADFTGFTGTLAGSQFFELHGSITLSEGMIYNHTGILYVRGSSDSVLTTNGVNISCPILIVKSGANLVLGDNCSTRATNNQSIRIASGGFNANGKDFILTGLFPRIGNGNLTFYNLIKEGSDADGNGITFEGNTTITNNLVLSGYSKTRRLLVRADVVGRVPASSVNITAENLVLSNVDFYYIAGYGAANWDISSIPGGSGDCGGNVNITFTTSNNWYWHADGGNFSDYTKWYTETNGGGTQMASTMVPLPQDSLYFDVNSFDNISQTVTQNMSRVGSINFTGATNNPALNVSTQASIFGSIILISGMSLIDGGNVYNFEGSGNNFLDSGGHTWVKRFNLAYGGGTLTLKSDFNGGTLTDFSILGGTLSAVDGSNNYNFTAGRLMINNSSLGIQRGVIMGSGTWTFNSTSGMSININSADIFDAGTSTVKINSTLTSSDLDVYLVGDGVKLEFYNFEITSNTGSRKVIIRPNNVYFENFSIINTSNNVKNIFFEGLAYPVSDDRHPIFKNFTMLGNATSQIIINSISTTTKTVFKKSGGEIVSGCDYLLIDNIIGYPDNTWYVGSNSYESTPGSTENIYFTTIINVSVNDTQLSSDSIVNSIILSKKETQAQNEYVSILRNMKKLVYDNSVTLDNSLNNISFNYNEDVLTSDIKNIKTILKNLETSESLESVLFNVGLYKSEEQSLVEKGISSINFLKQEVVTTNDLNKLKVLLKNIDSIITDELSLLNVSSSNKDVQDTLDYLFSKITFLKEDIQLVIDHFLSINNSIHTDNSGSLDSSINNVIGYNIDTSTTTDKKTMGSFILERDLSYIDDSFKTNIHSVNIDTNIIIDYIDVMRRLYKKIRPIVEGIKSIKPISTEIQRKHPITINAIKHSPKAQ